MAAPSTTPPAAPAATILVFLKAPRPGTVKTRLAREIGPGPALHVYRTLAEGQLRRLPTDWPVELHYTPADALDEMERWLGREPTFFPQAEGDLGARLALAVERAFSRDARRVLCIGADCPALDAAFLRSAVARLADGADVVFGPARDGGFTLVGLVRSIPALFESIPWSTNRTLESSLSRARNLGLRADPLQCLDDVDTLGDLQRTVAAGLLPAALLPVPGTPTSP